MPKTQKKRSAKQPRTWTFTLILEGVNELNEAVRDALFEAGCDDALAGSRDGVVFLDFDREADSFEDALLSAIQVVEDSKTGARVIRVEPDELVTMAEIARRTERSRENIRQLVTGLRGPGGFPPPVANLSRKSPIWRWREVRRWLKGTAENGAEASADESVDDTIALVNAALELRRHSSRDKAVALLDHLLPPPQGRADRGPGGHRGRAAVPAARG